MQPLPTEHRYIDPDQWAAYQTRAFGPLLDELLRRISALHAAGTSGGLRVAAKLALCCRQPVIITIADGQRYYLAESRCRSRVCPRCSRIRARALALRIADLIRGMDAPRFLTLTTRSTDQPLRDQVKSLRRRFANLRRRPEWGQHVRSGVYTIEITRNDQTGRWHPHLHAIIDGVYWPHQRILTLWEAVVGDHAGVDIRAVHGVRKLANYLACYVAKSCDLTHLSPAALAEWAVETHGLRLAQTFGSLQKCKPQTDHLEPQPIRVVEVDVNDLAYCAAHGWSMCDDLLRALEPTRRHRPAHDPARVLSQIHRFNNPRDRDPPRPRVRDPGQLRLLN